MKLRIKGNSIRLRLTQTEVNEFASKGEVSESTRFPQSPCLFYSLIMDDDIDKMQVEFVNGSLQVAVPLGMAKDWANSEAVGMDHLIPLKGGEELSILIEKDFQCLKARDGEDESEMYPHPDAGELRC